MTQPDVRRGRIAILGFLLGNGISLVGNMMAFVALPWFVLELTGSAAMTGLAASASAIPVFFASLIGGVLVDRLGGRTMSVVSDIVSGLAVLAVPALYLTVGLPFWQLFILIMLGAILDIPGITARRTLLPKLTSDAGYRPEAVNSTFEVMQGGAAIFGPVVAGMLIPIVGAVNLLWVTASTFAISAILIRVFAPAKVKPDPAEAESSAAMLQELMVGLRFIARDRLLIWLAAGVSIINFLFSPLLLVILPVMVFERYDDPSYFGFLVSAVGIGMVLAGAIFGTWGQNWRHRRHQLWALAFACMVATIWFAAIDMPFWLLLGLVLLAQIPGGLINPLSVTVRFERIPEALHGRVFATFAGISGILQPIGMIFVGYLLEVAGVDIGLVVVGALMTLLVAIAVSRPVLREMNRPVEEVSSATTETSSVPGDGS